MADRASLAYDRTAAAQLERLLYILPAAAQEGGQDPAQLALDLGVEPVQVFRDLEEVTARVYYHPSGGADDLQISIELGCVQVRTTGEFRRPPKLSKREALALSLEGEARILSPPELSEGLSDLAAQVVELYQRDAEEEGPRG